jgi:hypothetical protein
MLFALLGLLVYSQQAFAYTAVFCNNTKHNDIKVSLANSQAGCTDIRMLDVVDGAYADYGSSTSNSAARSMGGVTCSGACFTVFDVYDGAGNHVYHDRSSGICHSVRWTVSNTATGGWTGSRDEPGTVDFTNWSLSSASGSYCSGKLGQAGLGGLLGATAKSSTTAASASLDKEFCHAAAAALNLTGKDHDAFEQTCNKTAGQATIQAGDRSKVCTAAVKALNRPTAEQNGVVSKCSAVPIPK